ncbi:MAG TPA: hypothetical protein PKA82_02155 [Pyrinomonadaceae bacterium]|nr:hypothetical protein [Pyrinomonadaceae bacterium]
MGASKLISEIDQDVPRELTAYEVGGMTVNERLYVAGLFDAFYLAAAQKDEDRLRTICKKVHLSDQNIEVLVKNHIHNE